MKHRLWDYNGGLHLIGHKSLSNTRKPLAATIPKELIIPLSQSIGHPAEPIVAQGQRVLKGEKIAQSVGVLSASVHASSSGIVREITEVVVPHPSGLKASCIVIDTDGLDEEAPSSGLVQYEKLPPSALVSIIQDAGVVGLGGAAFPSSIKLNPGANRTIKTLILNGAECEPYITCDDMLMRDQALAVIEGARIILHTLGIKHCLIGVEDNKPEAIQALKKVCDELVYRNIDVVEVPTLYPTGGEKQLIKILTGDEIPVGKIPADIGIVCHNVGTATAIFQAVMGGKPLISRLITVTGNGIHQPQNLEVPIGTPIRDLIAQCGGYTDDAARLVMGGPMMGFALPNDDIPVVKATNSILVLAQADLPASKQSLPCIRCGKCAEVCPMDLLPQQLYWYGRAKNNEKAQAYNLFDCIECGSCDVVCPSHIPLVQYFRATKSAVRTANNEQQKADNARQRNDAHLLRLEQAKAERAERSRKKKAQLEDRKKSKETIDASVERAKNKKMARTQESTNSSDTTLENKS
ncbi:MAG: electron transport complex subunit RsxC [Gammaproteobacteria bacterium]|nr:MAG: electron transport complex subunit RsxC [Gammaproteobacteria bacterium]RLA24244.1 MAG: electron transport complex subunit RsxC [Gammaproteobacteria bacterium]